MEVFGKRRRRRVSGFISHTGYEPLAILREDTEDSANLMTRGVSKLSGGARDLC